MPLPDETPSLPLTLLAQPLPKHQAENQAGRPKPRPGDGWQLSSGPRLTAPERVSSLSPQRAQQLSTQYDA